jgi:hypothetical protein
MKFKTAVSSSKEVLFVGHERGNSKRPEEWVSETGRWKIDVTVFDQIINAALDGHSFGTSIILFSASTLANWMHTAIGSESLLTTQAIGQRKRSY